MKKYGVLEVVCDEVFVWLVKVKEYLIVLLDYEICGMLFDLVDYVVVCIS